ncbi:hypothetical protein MAPG_11166 [Magnaporthiopsis poae ATCC 64411]|uniref:Mg2+ transporter protein, CorA-like/Zinc transport protein ZntB n=1 Tax=Magnaporthiopsis poae (strain ATCC 64411 / 73-15) TaxID=644358 RepID=A0A0C4EEJ3_MAGP6|nr:hypothetical protein MAPG_11166 [Magnaporthiopsis poae ATCC 64411]
MPTKKPKINTDGGEEGRGYDLEWPPSQRWNPQYNVPRNSTELSDKDRQIQGSAGATFAAKQEGDAVDGPRDNEDGDGGLASLDHWLETSAELYMNDLDNRARWDPRWLNITRRERFQSLGSARITVVDYLKHAVVRDTFTTVEENGALGGSRSSSEKRRLAAALRSRPSDGGLRVVVVTDLSRFVMGALGQLFEVDPEFWFEHLTNSGYCGSDANLKIKNAVWMNWAQRETRFRHRGLPGPGQLTEWNGFHEQEIEMRIGGDGRLLMERDVALDRFGLTIRSSLRNRPAPLASPGGKPKSTGGEFFGPFGGASEPPKLDAGGKEGSARIKASNVYRPYSTFTSLPKNRKQWKNRDLRVMAPEGASIWSGADAEGRQTVLVVLDPPRAMRNVKTSDVTPSLTFMPRPMEIEAYTDEEAWRTADSGETYLDPPPLPLTKDERRAERKAAKRLRLQQRARRKALEKEAKKNVAAGKQPLQVGRNMGLDVVAMEEDGPGNEDDDDGRSEASHHSESSSYSEDEYREAHYSKYKNATWYARDRDFARKYALSTEELVLRYIIGPEQGDPNRGSCPASLAATTLAQISLDDLWRLLAEMRLTLDHIDADMATDLHLHLVEAVGITMQKDLSWARDTARELREYVAQLTQAFSTLCPPDPQQAQKSEDGCANEHQDLVAEMASLAKEVKRLQARVDSTLQLLLTSIGLAQSALVIGQTSGINKLTELAFIFIPLSFITSVFSMQVAEMTTNPPGIWIWGVTLAVVFVVTYSVRIFLRSPTVRRAGVIVRATIMNRFSSSSSASSSNRLNSLSARAVLKFVCAVLLTIAIFGPIFFGLLCLFIATYLVWFGTAAVSVYFLATRWPDALALGLCFGVGLPGSVLGFWLRVRFEEEVDTALERMTNLPALEKTLTRVRDRLLPNKWYYDNETDVDLAREGYSTYAKQQTVGT